MEFKNLQKDINSLYEWAAVIDHITLIFMERLLAKDLPEHLCFSFKKFYKKTSELMDHFNYCHKGIYIILKLDKLEKVLCDFGLLLGLVKSDHLYLFLF